MKCAYCGTSIKPTKEHVIPAGFTRAVPERQTFLARLSKIIGGDQKVKDVCALCNNGKLSDLDANALATLGPQLQCWRREDPEPLSISTNGSLLARWLLKVAYNSARAANSKDLHALEAQRDFILGREPSDTRLWVFGGLVRSYQLSLEEAAHYSRSWLDPTQFRIASWEPPFVKDLAISRALFFDVFGFVVCKLRRGPGVIRLSAQISKNLGFRRLVFTQSCHTLPVSNLDVISANQSSYDKNRKVYMEHLPDQERATLLERMQSLGLEPYE